MISTPREEELRSSSALFLGVEGDGAGGDLCSYQECWGISNYPGSFPKPGTILAKLRSVSRRLCATVSHHLPSGGVWVPWELIASAMLFSHCASNTFWTSLLHPGLWGCI